jgi:hypothetical protein
MYISLAHWETVSYVVIDFFQPAQFTYSLLLIPIADFLEQIRSRHEL